MGYPHPGLDVGTPNRRPDGVPPPIRTGWGYPLLLEMDGFWTGYAKGGTHFAVSRRRIFLSKTGCGRKN